MIDKLMYWLAVAGFIVFVAFLFWLDRVRFVF